MTPALPWWSGTVIYQLIVRSYSDGNGDGIGDFKGSAEMVPALTTIRIPARRIGRMAADRIAELIIGQTSGGGVKIENKEVEPEFKFRHSTAKC